MSLSEGIYILLGTNLGDRLQVLKQACLLIEKNTGVITKKSKVYQTEPWGISDQPAFLNQALQLETQLQPHALLKALQDIENTIGKKKVGKWRERLIDIDILYYGQMITHDQELTLPHPEIQNRRFALVPLCELSPDWKHPVLNQTQEELLATCPDTLGVWPRVSRPADD